MPTAPTKAPTKTPTVAPSESPWIEENTDPFEICPQQKREVISPDVGP